MHMGITRPGAGWTPCKADIVVGWHRGLKFSVQHTGAVFMPYFDFLTNLGRVHKQPLIMSIVLDMHVRNENVGVK